MYVNATCSVSPTLCFPHCVHKSVLYICLSIPAMEIGASVSYRMVVFKHFSLVHFNKILKNYEYSLTFLSGHLKFFNLSSK